MKQTSRIISTYSADEFGVASALYELGGLTVLHDASGCNSTYTTHDEPRWFDMESMFYISALSEMEAIMGNDEKFISDVCEEASELKPKFITIVGTPIPTMTGFDFKAVAKVIEKRTGILTFGMPTTGMNTYIHGASMAFLELANRVVKDTDVKTKKPSANILGLTPLDFSVNGSNISIESFVKDAGYEVLSNWAMGGTYEDIENAGKAHVNLVVSSSGIEAAKALKERFGTPYVIGTPIEGKFSCLLKETMIKSNYCGSYNRDLVYKPWIDDEAKCKCDEALHVSNTKDFGRKITAAHANDSNDFDKKITATHANDSNDFDLEITANEGHFDNKNKKAYIIGEGITSLSLAMAINLETGVNPTVICTTETDVNILRSKDKKLYYEEDIEKTIADANIVIADPLFKPICPEGAEFIALPTESFSGRIYRDEIPNLAEGFKKWLNNT